MANRTAEKLLRIFIGELDKLGSKPLYEEIIMTAQRRGLAGVTVLRGVESYGASQRLHTARVLRLAERLPLVIEIVDQPEKIEDFRSALDELLDKAGTGALVTLEAVEAFRYPPRHDWPGA